MDLWRCWLNTPGRAADCAAVPEQRPLARSHHTGMWGWMRYNQLWASPDLTPTEMAYRYDPDISDHALVTAIVGPMRLHEARHPTIQ